jgi:hypothetical protein
MPIRTPAAHWMRLSRSPARPQAATDSGFAAQVNSGLQDHLGNHTHPKRQRRMGRGLMPSGWRAKLARQSPPFRLNEKCGLSGSASPLEVLRWLRSRGHLPGLFVDRQTEHRQITRAPRDCGLVRIDQTCFGRSDGLAPTRLPLCQGKRVDAAGAGFSLSCSHSPIRLVW